MKTVDQRYENLRARVLTLGLAFAALFWITEALLDHYVFEERNLASSLLPLNDLHELSDRTVIAVGLMALIAYSQFVIKKRRRAEAEVRAKEERFRSLVQYASDVITVFDADGTIRYESPSVEQILGHRPEEMIGRNSLEYVHPDDAELVSGSLANLVKRPGSRAPMECRIRHSDGSWRYFESIANNLLEHPAVRGIVVNSRDVTERKRAETALEEALRMKTDFIADVSHELRTPLTVLRGNAEVGLETGCDCVHKEILAKQVIQSKRISRMVEDLLLLARSDSESLPLDIKSVEVAPFVEELASLTGALIRDRGVALSVELDGTGEARIDPGRIEQAILILVDNAARYSPKGSQVTFKTSTNSENLCLEITDNGPGISEEELPRIFERFYRSERTRQDNQNGSGLGLSIASTIAEVHGGRIEATSRVGEGTRMLLCVPLKEKPRTETEHTPNSEIGVIS